MSNDQEESAKKVPSEPHDTIMNSRARTESENETIEGAGAIPGKRQRTTSQQFMVASGMTAASPPKFVSLEEIMQAANGMRDMALVHQIVVDDDFKLKKAESETNTLYKQMKDTMHKAFWDLLREELNNDPPCYRQALVLLEDIRTGLFALLLPQHTKIKQQISEVLDADLIKQQAENGTLDFGHYAQYVISVMAKLCAPVRDEKIKELTEKTDVVETFKSILETLDLMHLDMANFTIKMARPDIIACSVELERRKFADFLSVQADGLKNTREWLLKHVDLDQQIPPNITREDHIRSLIKSGFWQACLDLIEWKEGKPFPETFMLDEGRLTELQVKTDQVVAIGTILLVSLSNAGPNLQALTSFKNALKENISILLQSVTKEKDLEAILPNVAEQVIKEIKDAQAKHNFPQMDETAEKTLRQQILDISKEEHRIKTLIRQRVKEFFKEIIESSTAAPQKVPSGLTSLQKELTEIAGQFLRIVSHNSAVFSIYYFDIISEALPANA